MCLPSIPTLLCTTVHIMELVLSWRNMIAYIIIFQTLLPWMFFISKKYVTLSLGYGLLHICLSNGEKCIKICLLCLLFLPCSSDLFLRNYWHFQTDWYATLVVGGAMIYEQSDMPYSVLMSFNNRLVFKNIYIRNLNCSWFPSIHIRLRNALKTRIYWILVYF